MDDGDAGFSLVGPGWQLQNTVSAQLPQTTLNAAYGADFYRVPGNGAGASKARWTFEGLEPGTYQIVGDVADGGRANGQAGSYTLYDGLAQINGFQALGGVVALTTVEQSGVPNDFNADGRAWERLDTITITGTTLTVELENRGGSQFSYMIADAVRVQRIDGNRGNDDDFHLAVGSPGVDRADPRSEYQQEPENNGARADMGAYGNTPEATPSPAQLMQVPQPQRAGEGRGGPAVPDRLALGGADAVRPGAADERGRERGRRAGLLAGQRATRRRAIPAGTRT